MFIIWLVSCITNNFKILGQEVGKVVFKGTCYVVYCDSNSKIAKKEVECEVETTTTPVDIDTTKPIDTTTPFETTTTLIVTTKPKQCIYNQFVYQPGQMIGIVLVREDCFLVYCDKDSEIKKKSVACPSTTTPVSWTQYAFKFYQYLAN